MIDKKQIIAAYKFRHACKLFDAEKVIAKEDIDFILETARLSPSSFGFEPWHFVVVQDKKLRTKLKDNAWGATAKLDTASHFILGLTMKAPLIEYNSTYIKDFMKEVQELPQNAVKGKGEMFEIFQKSDFDLTDERKLFDWAAKQCYIPLANMMTSAAMIGIDSCPIEGFVQSKIEKTLKEDLDINTDQYGISYMVAFGYRVNEPRDKTRRKTNQIVTYK